MLNNNFSKNANENRFIRYAMLKLGRFWSQLKEEENDDDDDRKVGLAMASLPSTTLAPTTAFSSARAPSFAPRTAASLPADKLPGCPSPSSLSPRALTVVGSPAPGLRSRTRGTFRCFAAVLTPQLKSTLDTVVNSHKVVLFMKGTKDFPQCGFSNTVVQILKSFNVPFETINILENDLLRQGLKEYSSWPTFPQLYIDGEFFGGRDITVEAYKSGELQELLEKAMCS